MQRTLFGQDIIKSISFDQHEIIKNILALHCKTNIELDPTYSIGNFYQNGIHKPKYKFDIDPQLPEVEKASADNLPLNNCSINTMIFDPPFLFGGGGNETSKTKLRFSSFTSVDEMFLFYHNCLIEFYRILKQNGILIFKCQDMTEKYNHFTHIFVINTAISLGFYAKDLFVLFARQRLIALNHQKQNHARKYHSYFIVFEKKKVNINYLAREARPDLSTN